MAAACWASLPRPRAWPKRGSGLIARSTGSFGPTASAGAISAGGLSAGRSRRRPAEPWRSGMNPVKVFLISAVLAVGGAQAADASKYFVLIYSRGPAWKADLPMKDQGLGPHVRY